MPRIYSPNEVLSRYLEWAATPPDHSEARKRAWWAYCDARDELEEGSAQKKEIGAPDDRQGLLFQTAPKRLLS